MLPEFIKERLSGHAQATPDGIRLGNKLLGYSVAIRQLDEGQFDDCLSDGLNILAEIQQARVQGWFRHSDDQAVIIWRWLVATLFICEQLAKNGTAEVPHDDGTTKLAVRYVGKHGGITVYPATERFSLANNVEGAAIERYPHDHPQLKAVQIYQSMVSVKNGSLRLSDWGRDSLALLHDGFIEMLNTEGMPAAPVAH